MANPEMTRVLHLCRGDVNRSIIEGASFGRDADTIANLCGLLAGALEGASAIRHDWVETVERANEPFFEEAEGSRNANFMSMARRLVKVLHKERQAALDRAALLGAMLR